VTVVAMVLLVVDWPCFVVGVSVFVLTVVLTRYVSLGSMLGGLSGPITLLAVHYNEARDYLLSALCLLALAIMVILLHHKNVIRLFKGTERKFRFKKD